MKVDKDRALYLEDIKALVIADLHIGYEDELRERGIMVPPVWRSMKKRIESLLKRYNVDTLIILGDIKHAILQKPRDIKRMFEDLSCNIIGIKGNHDGNIETMVDFEIKSPKGYRIGRYGFIHGHSWPGEDVMKAEILFMGHMHPEIELFDSLGRSNKMACLLRGRLTEKGERKYKKNLDIVVLPAFNPLVGAALGKPLGPLFKNNLIGDMEVYLLNGTYLGKYRISQYQAQERSL